jgi:hypothetical protein
VEWHLRIIGRLKQGGVMADCSNDLEGSQTIYKITWNSGKVLFNEEYSLTLLRNYSKARTRIKLKTNYLNYATYLLGVHFRFGSISKHIGLGMWMIAVKVGVSQVQSMTKRDGSP